MGLSTAAAAVRGGVGAEVASTWRTDPVPWVAGLFLATFLLQRIAVPGLPIPITVPLAVGWVVLMALVGLVEFNRVRLVIWLVAAGLSGVLIILQTVAVVDPFVSLNSWALWIVVWLPLVVQLRQRDRGTFLRFARAIARIGTGLAALSLLFIASQLVGVRYNDWLASVVPADLLVKEFVVSYPIVYGSELYKSNGWIALEPSFMSFFLGIALICALLARVRVAQVLFIAAGLLSTLSGSGLALVVVFLVALAAQGKIGSLRRYLVPGAVLGLLFASTFLGEAVLSRITEAGSASSSTSLRATEPYVQLWPHFVADPIGIFIGHGPGSSANVVSGLGINGLLVPNVAKVVYDYGMVAGALLVALMASAYFRGPSPAFALSQAASMFLLQGAAQALIVCSILAIAFWAPTTPIRPTTEAVPRLGRDRSWPSRR